MTTQAQNTVDQHFTIPLKPVICLSEEAADHMDKDEMELGTGLVVVAPQVALTPEQFEGADKVTFNVAAPSDLAHSFIITGEFVSGAGDYSEVCISMYPNNALSPDFGGLAVRLPLKFIATIRTKAVI